MMPKLRRRTYNFLMLVTALTAVVLLWRIENNQDTTPNVRDTSDAPSWIISQPVIQHYDSTGLMIGRIKADLLEFYQADKSAHMSRPRLEQGELIDSEWETHWFATAERGFSTNLGAKIDLKGDVNVYNLLHHYHLHTNTLHANSEAGILSTEAFVKVTSPDSTLTANGVTANWHQQHIELIDNVHVKIQPR